MIIVTYANLAVTEDSPHLLCPLRSIRLGTLISRLFHAVHNLDNTRLAGGCSNLRVQFTTGLVHRVLSSPGESPNACDQKCGAELTCSALAWWSAKAVKNQHGQQVRCHGRCEVRCALLMLCRESHIQRAHHLHASLHTDVHLRL